MEFTEKLKGLASRIENLKDSISTEEATKTSLIMPFFAMLGYDVFNPLEFVPEFTADVGIKKGEKVDYAIMVDGNPVILVEAKSNTEQLDKHGSQLFRYFGTTSAKFGILTNGAVYQFYTDLETPNKMDTVPFLEINLLELRDSAIPELRKFTKENFNINKIFDAANDLKYTSQIKNILEDEFSNPSDDFTRLVLTPIYEGMKTQAVIDKFKPLVKKSITQFINEKLNDKLKSAIQGTVPADDEVEETLETEETHTNDIITTMEEIESYIVVRTLLMDVIDPERIYYKDTHSYFSIIVDNKVTRWVCRVFLKESVKYIIIQDANGTDNRYDISSVNDIVKYKNELSERLEAIK